MNDDNSSEPVTGWPLVGFTLVIVGGIVGALWAIVALVALFV